jgi:hypothetical protein
VPTNPEVRDRLSEVAASERRAARLSVDQSGQDALGRLVAAAADRMEQEGRLSSDDLVEAERAFSRLVAAVAAEGDPSYAPGADAADAGEVPRFVAHEASVTNALQGICPIWPIC